MSSVRVEEKVARKKSEHFTYLKAAVMSTFGITSIAVMVVYSRFSWQMEVYIFHISLSNFVISLNFAEIGILFLIYKAEKFLIRRCLVHLLYLLAQL